MGIDELLQNVLNILEADDGKSFEEKKEAAIKIIRQTEDSGLANLMTDRLIEENDGKKLRNRFWKSGDVIYASPEIMLRKVSDADREKFIEVRLAYSALKSFMEEALYHATLWNEHTGDMALMFSIYQNNDYIGYCGIHDVTCEDWEIAIELQPEKTNRGVGSLAITKMLNELQCRLGKTDYRVRIEPTNYASQRLFEKLGAVPNGITTFLVRDPKLLEEYEEENLGLIDDKLISVAEKFSVAPRKLLSHILEYKLVWE